MFTSIQISKLNDFLFCPYSLYFHSLYENYDKTIYHRTFQTVGSIAHEKVDKGKHTTSKHVMQGTEIYSSKYNLIGKLDTYDRKTHVLTERKYKIKTVFDGYKMQLYAEYFCLKEMGHHVQKLELYSMSDNKKYTIPLPDKEETQKFENLIADISQFAPDKSEVTVNPAKCKLCIYNELCVYKK